MTPAHWLALIESQTAFDESFGLPGAEGLREFVVGGDVSPQWLEALREVPAADPWTHGFVVVHVTENCVIGTCGFKGPPDADGMAEIAYGIVPAYRRRGFATAAAQLLMQRGRELAEVQLFRAHTLPDNPASHGVLRNCGFAKVGEVDDPDDGHVWRWERQP